jgi:hypothetical protein
MLNETIKDVLMRRDKMTSEEADDLIRESIEDLSTRLTAGELVDETDFAAEWFGLEPDYLWELI